MRKKIFLLFIIFSSVMQLFGKNWYVSNAQAGNGDATSWANAMNIKNMNMNWQNAHIVVGDTVFIDGGSDNLVYDLSNSTGDNTKYGILIYIAGNSSNKIVFTRGLEPNHNGTPIFRNFAGRYIWGFKNSSYVELSHLQIEAYTTTALIAAGYKGYGVLIGGDASWISHDIDILSNDIDWSYIDAISLNGTTYNIRIMHNNLYTTEAADVRLDSLALVQSNAIHTVGTNHSYEIAYNTMINNTSLAFLGQEAPHRDFMQINTHNTGNQKTKIHHNFIATDFAEHSSSFINGFKFEDVQGNYEMYDNIFVWSYSSGDVIDLNGPSTGNNYPPNVSLYNNVFVKVEGDEDTHNNNMNFIRCGAIKFKNNLVNFNEDRLIGSLSGTSYDFTNNQYIVPDALFVNSLTYAQWVATGQENGSEKTTFTLLDNDFTTFSDDPTDYMLEEGSSGIDEGIDLSSLGLYTDDYSGTERPVGASWDVGAFEFKDIAIIGDTTPPNLLSASVINPTTIELLFSEALDISSALTKTNYSINNGIVVNIVSLSTDSKKVTLSTTLNIANQTYTVVVNNVKDLAGNVISSSNNIAQYSYVGDSTPPNLLSASVINPTTIELSFSEVLENNSALTESNYSINNGIVVNSASLSTDLKKVTLTTTLNIANQTYTVVVNNVKDLAGNVISSSNNIAQYSYVGDSTPPNLLSASVINPTTIELSFSEVLENNSALTESNYSINNGIVVNSASLSTDLKKVTLTTTLNIANQTYTVVVNNVKDLAGNVISSSNNIAQYSYVGDSTPPNLLSASVINPTTIELSFSEVLENNSALTESNYSINNGIVVNSASLSTDLKKVTLSTTLNIANQTYTVVVNNVKDLAGNVISSQANSAQYEYFEQTGDLVMIPIVFASATHWFQNYTPDKTIDGQGISNPDSRWNGAFPMPDTIKFDLGTSVKISRTRVSFYNWDGGRKYKFNLLASLDGVNWQTVVSEIWSNATEWTESNFNLVNARYLSLISLENNQSVYAGVWEMEVWGPSSSETDTIPPNLLSAKVLNPTTIELLFSEALDNSSALTKTNYSINNGIVVNSVSLSPDGRQVTLNTNTNVANQTYTVVVINVKDLAGNIISPSNNSALYSYVGDTTPPNLLSAAVLNPTTIDLLFSEALETVSAQITSNYSINNGIVVNSATLSSDKSRVTLNTTLHIPNQNYTVTVNNVKDLAGNTLSTNNSVQYSFEDNTVGDLLANVRIFLQGPYQSNSMITELSSNEFIPNQQPYNNEPWLYNGSEVLTSSSNLIVDWILVELRNAENPVQVISRRAGLLRNDGRIMEPDGSLGVTFKKILYGSYYIAVYHRNHLAVMTSTPVLFTPDNTLYDFTNSLSKAYGQNAMIEIATGVFGMYAGDGDGDGIIYDNDRNEIWSAQNGSMDYLNGDFNLDSGVTIKDINEYWNFNQGKTTQVPQNNLLKATDDKILGAYNFNSNLRQMKK